MPLASWPIAVNHVTGDITYSSNISSPGMQPTDHGLLGWAYDPALAVNTSILAAAGTVYVVRVPVRSAATVTNVHVYVTTAGGTLTSGQCFAGLFDSAGVLLSATATQHTAWESTGFKTMALTAPQSVAASTSVYVGFFANGSTLPTFARTAVVGVVNSNLSTTVGSGRFASADTGRTTSFPATLGALTLLSNGYWVALS